jgi:phospholipid transport system substrate-binding protein
MSKTKRTLMMAAVALGVGLATVAQPARAFAATGVATVQAFYDTLLNTMRNGARLGMQGRYAQLSPAIRQSFDIPFMTRLAVGPEWNSVSQAQQAQLTQAFERYIAAVYAERFDSYAGEQLKVIGEQASPAGTVITSQIVKSTGEPVHINYLMHQNGGSWQIADVYLNGTISELATHRSEFATILRTRGVDGLIAALNEKTVALGASRAS